MRRSHEAWACALSLTAGCLLCGVTRPAAAAPSPPPAGAAAAATSPAHGATVSAAPVRPASKPAARPAPPLGPIDQRFVDEVWAEICALGIAHPHTVMAQAMMETGWLRAPFLMTRNNLFGFRQVQYLSFPDWRDSVRFYKAWQERNLRPSDTSYEAFLTRIRYGAPGYVHHLRKLKWTRACPVAPQEPAQPVESSQPAAPAPPEPAAPPEQAPSPAAAASAPGPAP